MQGSGNEATILISHQWMTDGMTGSNFPGAMGSKGIYLAPLKQMKVRTDGTPRALHWSGNEARKGHSIALPPLGPAPPSAPPPSPVRHVDVAACGTATWTVPDVGAAKEAIALKSSATLTNLAPAPAPRSGTITNGTCGTNLAPAPAPQSGTITNGTCSTHSVQEDCDTRLKGVLPNVGSFEACAAKVYGCAMAAS